MTGFLQRIAAQTIGGTGGSLRSLARLPYAPQPLSPSGYEAAEEPAAARNSHGNRLNPLINSGVGPEQVLSQNHPELHRPVTGIQPIGDETEYTSPVEALPQREAGFTAKPSLSGIQPALANLRQASPYPEVTVELASPDGDGGMEIPSQLDDFVPKSGSNRNYHRSLADSAIPAPLIPSNDAAQAPVFNAQKMKQSGEPGQAFWQGRVEETTEVHVSIGRIEVTAVHEAPPAKRQTPAAAKPMALEEYLARRRREA